MTYSSLIFTVNDHIAHIVLNKPESANAIDQLMAQELDEVCAIIDQTDDVYIAIISGAGKSFCIGGEAGTDALGRVQKITIAAVQGDCLGTGLEMVLGCDIRLAADDALFGLPDINRGLMPAHGGTQRLPRIVGKGKALEMILTGEAVSAQDAIVFGLVSQVLPKGELLGRAEAMAHGIAQKAPISLRFTKEAVNKGLDLTLDQGIRLEADLYFLIHTTKDRTEGIRAFLEKRPPHFQGQ